MKLIFTDYYIYTFLRISPDACEDMCASFNTNFKLSKIEQNPAHAPYRRAYFGET